MTKLHSYRLFARAVTGLLALPLAICCFARGQILYQDQEVQVHNLPVLTARSDDPADVLSASLDTILNNKEICCGRDSALGDSLASADPKSLKDVAQKLAGRHLLGDGRPIQMNAEFRPAEAMNAGDILRMILYQRPPLMEWNSHLYVVHGVVFIWNADAQGGTYAVIRKILLWDIRYSNSRRQVTFTRGIDDMATVEGLLFVEAPYSSEN